MVNPIKISGGAFFVLLGLVLLGKFENDIIWSIIGVISIAIGFGLIAWDFNEKN
jgi:hypothetical protein